MAATRVYILARELGVKSSAIVNKCEAEGLDVKNHMSVISAGLAATIREWFSESENVTTVETTQKVDLKRVRIRKKTKKKKAVEEQEPKDAKQAEQEKTEEKKVEKIKKSEVKKKQEPDKPIKPEAEVEVAEPEPPKAPPKIVPPKEPEPIKPAGPILEKPAPARLTGPDVVRVEKPEPLRRPRPRRSEPVTEPLIYSKQDGDALQVPVGSDVVGSASRHKERTRGRRTDDKPVRAPKKFKFGRLRQRDIEERQARLDAAGGEGLRLRPTRRIAAKLRAGVAVSAKPTKVVVSEPITVKALSAALAVKTGEIISKLIQQNVMASANQIISSDVAELVALEFGRELQVERKERIEQQIHDEFDRRQRKSLSKRAVVATMLGHVDHGKTSLLDRIRSTHVTQGEAGGITQHIGAYQVSLNDSKVTFLDTPGHEAFTSMRARGANMTDVVVLVVAADDGIMPQTVEAIAHSNAAGVPVLVALNKIDLPGCDFNRIYSQLSEHDLTPIEWGGDTDVVKTSAVTGEGIDDLLEHLDYAAELLELKADDTIPATGWVVEARMSATRGPVATLLIKEGRLGKGAVVLAGAAYGRIKTLRNSQGKSVKVATSSTPVEITGLGDVPQAGDRFYCLDDINRAKAAAEENQVRSRESSLAERTQVTLDNLFSQIEAGKVKELNLIIRADVQGSVDVLTKYLSELSTDEVKLKILHATPGGITEGDVVLAEASNAIVIGFNVVADERVEQIAETGGVDIRLYNVIYRITDDLRMSMAGLLEPEEQEQTLGRAVVRKTFKVSKVGTIAGCYVNSGVVTNKAHVRLIRDNVVVRNALAVDSLKHFKDDVREVKTGLECGVKFAKFDDVKEDDVLEFYTIVKVQRTL